MSANLDLDAERADLSALLRVSNRDSAFELRAHSLADGDTMHYSHDSFRKELGVRLKLMRKERGWSVRHMVVQHGFHLTQWQSFENGRGMSISTLLRICGVFAVRVETLVQGLGFEDDHPSQGEKETSPEERPAIPSAAAVPGDGAKEATRKSKRP